MQLHFSQSSFAKLSRQRICSGCNVSLQALLQPVLPSQSSPFSRTLLPHLGWQSLSVLALASLGQQPSSLTSVVIASFLHSALQFAGLPLRLSAVHAFLSSQSAAVLHGVSVPGSQVSPA